LGEEPETGASTNDSSRSASAAPIRRASAGAIVDMSIISVPGAAACAAPSSPSSTCSTCGPSTTIVITAAAPSAAARGVAATRPPCSATQASAFDAVRL
jgi:hypothetical protein